MVPLLIVLAVVVLVVGFVVVGFNKLRTADIGAQEALGTTWRPGPRRTLPCSRRWCG
jgi:hypothetical protein